MTGEDWTLLAWAASCVVLMIVLIGALRLSAFLALIITALVLGIATQMPPADVIEALTKGFGDIAKSIGIILVLGTILGSIIAGSGGADRIAAIVTNAKTPMTVAWGMMAVALLVGLPLFFETGLAILMPIILRIAQRLKIAQDGDRYLLVAMPVLAGLSVAHGLLPPHPGALAATAALEADVGLVLLLGVIVAIPSAALAGPIYTSFMWKKQRTMPNLALAGAVIDEKNLPPLATTLFVLFLPVVLIAAGSLARFLGDHADPMMQTLMLVGDPNVALLIAVAAAYLLLGVLRKRSLKALGEDVAAGSSAIAIILLIIGAGGSLKEMLLASGVGEAIGKLAASINLSAIVLGWLAAVLMRIATGSATVATVTAAGLVAPLALGLGPIDRALTVLAIGGGSVILSHVNNSGFWMVREYLGMNMKDTFKTWSALETIIAFVVLSVVLVLAAVLPA